VIAWVRASLPQTAIRSVQPFCGGDGRDKQTGTQTYSYDTDTQIRCQNTLKRTWNVLPVIHFVVGAYAVNVQFSLDMRITEQSLNI